ncbi:hypothetical protein NFI96_025884 [Prochilodus magdalenae]|nr:hypothetical protein NFI96_025884 [Prochilodus magdalenae]
MLLHRVVYIRAGGRFLSYQFTNTCVLDSILAALHICYIKYSNVRSLLESDTLLKVIMDYLNAENYAIAKVLWLRKLGRVPEHSTLDCKSCVQDHFPVWAKLVCAEVDYRQETPSGHAIYETTLSKFRALGDVKALGSVDDPALILVKRDLSLNLPKPPLSAEDDNHRVFNLQFLLLGEETHMVMCFNFTKNIWVLYDDDPTSCSSSFRVFNYEEELDRYVICLAAYVNSTEAEEHKYGIAETGGGATPFDSGSSGQQRIPENPVEDIRMMLENLSCGTSE